VPISAQQSSLLLWYGSDPAQTSGLGQNRPDPKKEKRGNYFAPHVLLHAERYLFCMQEEMKMKETLEGKEKLLSVEEEVPLLDWLRTLASLVVL